LRGNKTGKEGDEDLKHLDESGKGEGVQKVMARLGGTTVEKEEKKAVHEETRKKQQREGKGPGGKENKRFKGGKQRAGRKAQRLKGW